MIENVWQKVGLNSVSKKPKKKEKPKYSNAGKGDKSRVTDKNKFDKNWEKIFGKGKKKNEKTINDTGNRRKARDEVSDR